MRQLKDTLAYARDAVKRPAQGCLPHDYLVPGGFYQQQWDWDAFFIGLGLVSEDPADAVWLKHWALNCLAHADPDGRIPGCITPDGPRPTLFCMKPFLAQGIHLAQKHMGDGQWIRDAWQDIRHAVTYRERTLWDTETDLALWHNAMESGADNNVALLDFPDRSVVAADANAFICREYRCMARLAAFVGSKADELFFARRAQQIQDNMHRHLWHPGDQIYYNLSTRTRQHIKAVSYSSFVPLWAGIAPHEDGQASLRRYVLSPDHLFSTHGIRTLSKQDPRYNNENIITPHSNWQGPVWPIANYLYMHALIRHGFRDEAIALARTIGCLVLDDIKKTGGMHENYHAETGEPLAAPNFVSWNILVRTMMDEAVAGVNPLE